MAQTKMPMEKFFLRRCQVHVVDVQHTCLHILCLQLPLLMGIPHLDCGQIVLVVVLDGSFSMMLRNKLHVSGRDRKMLFGWVARVLEIMLGAE